MPPVMKIAVLGPSTPDARPKTRQTLTAVAESAKAFETHLCVLEAGLSRVGERMAAYFDDDDE